MSLARVALGELAALGAVLAQRPKLPLIPLCRQQADARPPFEGVAPLPASNLIDQMRRDLAAACAAPGGAGSLPARLLRMAPLVLWNGEPYAARLPGLLEAFLRVAQSRPRWLGDLIEAWLRDFGPDRILLPEAGWAIAGLLAGATHPRLTPWRQAHERYSLFDANEGPRRLGHALLHGPDTYTAVLRETGMDDPLRANGGFFRACVAEVVHRLPTTMRVASGRNAWSRAVELLEEGRPRPALRFAELTGETARACLDPWLQAGGAYVPREEVKAFLLRTIGDPRLRPDRWASVGEHATGLMRAWMAQASLETFLSLISEGNDAKQWRARQKFWRACLARIPSAEVWVVLGPGLANRARVLRDLAGGFGEVDGASGENQAALLMKLGSLVLSEWSNVGALRAWHSGGATCPKLYQERYDHRQLKSRSLEFPGQTAAQPGRGLWHSGPWQDRAAELLVEKLGVRLRREDYL